MKQYLAAFPGKAPGHLLASDSQPPHPSPTAALEAFNSPRAVAYEVEPCALPDWARASAKYCHRIVRAC